MKLQKAIDNRHSIREFEKKKVSKTILKKIISNATKAPSGKNEQPWNFYVVTSEDKRGEIINETKKTFKSLKEQLKKMKPEIRTVAEKFNENLGDAPHIIFVYRNKKGKEPVYQKFNDIAAISASIENLMLSATAEGLGTCWIGMFKGVEKKLKKILKIPKNQEYVTGLIIGYPKKESKILIRKRKKLNEILKFI